MTDSDFDYHLACVSGKQTIPYSYQYLSKNNYQVIAVAFSTSTPLVEQQQGHPPSKTSCIYPKMFTSVGLNPVCSNSGKG